jgi:hypothetical protein
VQAMPPLVTTDDGRQARCIRVPAAGPAMEAA